MTDFTTHQKIDDHDDSNNLKYFDSFDCSGRLDIMQYVPSLRPDYPRGSESFG